MDVNTERKEATKQADSMTSDELKMNVEVEDRIHIVPLGYERDRVIVPPREMRADKVVLVTHARDDEEEVPEYYSDIYDAFEEASIEVEEAECDIFDLYDALGTMAGLIQQFPHDDVHVNLATGGKVTAIAGMIACMVTESAIPYYVSAENYGDHRKTPVAQKVTNISNLPTYPINAPTREQVQMLAQIANQGPISKQGLISYAENEQLPFIADYESDEPKGKYRKLDAHILNPLLDDGYVISAEQGRKKMIDITPDGENTLHAFRYMLDQD